MNKKYKDLTEGLDKNALVDVYLNLKKEYMNLRIKQVSPVEGFNPSIIKQCRKNIARVKTRLRQLESRKEVK